MIHSAKDFEAFRDKVRAQKLDPSFNFKPVVATLAGPCAVIEIIVAQAQHDSGIPMDWSYCGGRAMVVAKGDRKKARSALFCAMGNSDLTQLDL